jgi:phosphonate transport system substrate-binding protein
MQRRTLLSLLAGLALSPLPLNAAAAPGGAPLRLSMLPLYSAEEISKQITPLAALLSKALGVPVEPMVVKDFKEYEQRLGRDIDIGYENPNVYVRAANYHEAVAMVSKAPDGPKFRGIVITRADSAVVGAEDLRGKRVSIVGLTSTGGYLSQRLTLMQEGIDPARDMIIEEALDNKQENVILSVYNGDVEAGFIRESALRQVDAYVPPSQIKVIKKTAFLPEWAVSVNRNLPPEAKAAIRDALTGLKSGDPVLKTLKIDAFVAAEDRDYDPMRQAVGIPPPVR